MAIHIILKTGELKAEVEAFWLTVFTVVIEDKMPVIIANRG